MSCFFFLTSTCFATQTAQAGGFNPYRTALGVTLNSVAARAWNLTGNCNNTEKGGVDLSSAARPDHWPKDHEVLPYFKSAVARKEWHVELKSTWSEGAAFPRHHKVFCSMRIMLLALGTVEEDLAGPRLSLKH